MQSFKRTVLAGALVATLALGAEVSAKAESFNTTNSVAANTSITSWPTNSVTTNGVGRLTGGAVSLFNQNAGGASIYFRAAAATTVGVRLITAQVDSPPRYVVDTNGWVLANDWITNNSVWLVASASDTNAFTWGTNIDALINGANWIGVYQVTNGAGAITNFGVNINKKVLPVRLN
jgi:hypothetical protein